MRYTTLLLLAGLVFFTCTGSLCSGGGSSGGPTVSSTVEQQDPNFQPPYNKLLLGCSNVGTAPPPTMWTVYFSNNTHKSEVIFWEGGNGQAQTLNFYVDPSSPQVVSNNFSSAIQEWYYALANNASGTLLLNVAQSTDEYSPVKVYPDHNGNLGLNPDEAGNQEFGAIPTGLPLGQTFLQSATIVISSDVDNGTAYAASLHEIGHALGLWHSLFQSSVMFPYTGQGCFLSPGTQVPDFDTGWLESVYDPSWTVDTPDPTDKCLPTRGQCGQSKTRKGVVLPAGAPDPQALRREAAISAGIFQTPYVRPGFVDIPRAGTATSGIEFNAMTGRFNGLILKRGQLASVYIDDHNAPTTLSPARLLLASTLVAKVHILGDAGRIRIKPYDIHIRRARVERIYRHLYGPDASIHVGDLVDILDRQPADTEYFLDNPPLGAGTSVILLMQRNPNIRSKTPTYNLTGNFVSRIGEDSEGRLYVAGPAGSRLARAINSAPKVSFLSIMSSQSGADRASEAQVLGRLLSTVGIANRHSLGWYEAMLARKPWLVTRAFMEQQASRTQMEGR